MQAGVHAERGAAVAELEVYPSGFVEQVPLVDVAHHGGKGGNVRQQHGQFAARAVLLAAVGEPRTEDCHGGQP